MKQWLMRLVVLGLLVGCAQAPAVEEGPGSAAGASGSDGQIRPLARPATLDTTLSAPPPAARTVEEFDTTTAEQRSDAVAEAASAVTETDLGRTIASLGSPSEPGFWLKTPLVSAPARGRVVYPASGKSVAVDLIPIDGPKTAGSRMSLPAMRLIEAPLTELPEIQVYLVSG